jgi:hypothetical protein
MEAEKCSIGEELKLTTLKYILLQNNRKIIRKKYTCCPELKMDAKG